MSKFYSELTTEDLVQHRERLGKELEKYTKHQRQVYDDIQQIDKELELRTKDNT